MSLPTPTITAYFDIDGASTVFILDDPVRGVLDDATYVLGGDLATDLTDYVRVTSITRGRDRALNEFNAGVANLTVNNQDRAFDPDYTPGTYYGNLKPGKKVEVAADGVTIFTGKVEDWDYDYPVSTDSTALPAVVDDLATLASAEFDEWTTTGGQTAGTRLDDILDRNEVQFGANRDFDTGTSTLQADLVSWGSNVLNYCQLVVRADLGQFFASRTGVLTFYGRNRAVTTTGVLEFRDDGTGIPYAGIRRAQRTELLFNRVSVDAIGFTKQTVINQASIDEFQKVWSLSISGLPLSTEAQALDIANYLLSLYSQPLTRIASITVLLHDYRISTTDTAAILSLDMGSVVRVVYTPNEVGDPIDQYCMVEGINHELAPTYHAVTLSLSNLADGFSGRSFILDDAEWGLLDGVGVLSF